MERVDSFCLVDDDIGLEDLKTESRIVNDGGIQVERLAFDDVISAQSLSQLVVAIWVAVAEALRTVGRPFCTGGACSCQRDRERRGDGE